MNWAINNPRRGGMVFQQFHQFVALCALCKKGDKVLWHGVHFVMLDRRSYDHLKAIEEAFLRITTGKVTLDEGGCKKCDGSGIIVKGDMHYHCEHGRPTGRAS